MCVFPQARMEENHEKVRLEQVRLETLMNSELGKESRTEQQLELATGKLAEAQAQLEAAKLCEQCPPPECLWGF
jgi:hypothetical protein